MELTLAILLDRADDRLVAAVAAQHRARARFVQRQIALASLRAQRAEPQILLAERRRVVNVDQIGGVEQLHGVLARLEHAQSPVETHLRGARVLRA